MLLSATHTPLNPGDSPQSPLPAMSNTSWTPNETPDVIFTEKTWLQGAILTGVGYGIVFTLYCMTAHALLVGLRRSDYKNIGWLVYITIIFFLGSIFMGACAQMTQLSFVQYRNIPGGPSEYENVEFSIPADEAGNVVFVLTNWFADGLMVRVFHRLADICELRGRDHRSGAACSSTRGAVSLPG